mmetsp:Transcript_1585/g.3867  ORF Transcript_1585/g.3867 Transcript_1585/m.3867 type:complete len:200 (-) Transcript_1585:1654-2253(-)
MSSIARDFPIVPSRKKSLRGSVSPYPLRSVSAVRLGSKNVVLQTINSLIRYIQGLSRFRSCRRSQSCLSSSVLHGLFPKKQLEIAATKSRSDVGFLKGGWTFTGSPRRFSLPKKLRIFGLRHPHTRSGQNLRSRSLGSMATPGVAGSCSWKISRHQLSSSRSCSSHKRESMKDSASQTVCLSIVKAAAWLKFPERTVTG